MTETFIEINGKKIGPGHPTYFIAEGGLNHNGDIKLAKKLVDEAKNSGASAIKFQTYKTESFVRKSNMYFPNFKGAELAYDEFWRTKRLCKKCRSYIFFLLHLILKAQIILKKSVFPVSK